MAYLLQSLVIFAVMASNIYWHWTPSGYIPALLGVGLAYGLTLLALGAKRWFRQDHGAEQSN